MNNYYVPLYKFRDINKYSIESLIKGTLYFPSPEKLNDPFDCRIDIEKSIRNAAISLEKDKEKLLLDLLIHRNFNKFITKVITIGVCSFSLELKNVILWSHYSNNHQGMCIRYDFPEDYLNDGSNFIGISPVAYEEDALSNWFIDSIDVINNNTGDLEEYFIELAKKYFTSKSPNWIYEREVRIIRPKPGLFKIDKAFVKEICFGLNTSDDDIELIKEITNHYDKELLLCRIIRTDNDFGINVEVI